MTDILKTINFFHADGTTFELCGLGPKTKTNRLWEGSAFSGGGKKGVVAGWFNDKKKAVEIAKTLNQIGAEGIYVTLNECHDSLLARANNRLIAGIPRTQDIEIMMIRWLLIDVDVKRAAGISSTNAEHQFALDHADWIGAILKAKSWPNPLCGDSGNGAHLAYRLPDLENNPENIELVKSALQALQSLYTVHKDGVTLEIDTKVFNPARISKLYGTHARKGDHTTERPFRQARIRHMPDVAEPVSLDLLNEIIELGKKEGTPAPGSQAKHTSHASRSRSKPSRFNLPAYFDKYQVEITGTKQHGESTLHILRNCIFDSSHSGGEASIGQTAEGKLFYQCFHDSCKSRTWQEAKKEISGEDGLSEFTGGGSSEPAGFEEILERIEEINQKHAIIMLGGKCLIMNEVIDPIFGRPDINFSSPADFKTLYANQKIWIQNGKGTAKTVSIADLWIEHQDRRQYRELVFSPGEKCPGCYNLYRGMAFEPRKGSWKLLQEHIYHVVCKKDPFIFTYLLGWMADTVQHPGGRRPGVSIVLRGGQGTGKGLFARTYGELFGSHYLHITHQSQLVGKFNQHQKDALLIFADECFWAGDKQAEGIIKRTITEPTFQIEPKGKDVFTVKNHIRLIIASNENWVIPAGIGERRFLVLDIDETHMQKRSYFDPIYDEIDNGGREAMLYDLLEHVYDPGSLREAPKTEALLSQIEEGMEPEAKFWYHCLKRGKILNSNSTEHWESDFISSSQLYAEFIEFAKTIGKQFRASPDSFGRRLRKFCPEITRKQQTVSRTEWDVHMRRYIEFNDYGPSLKFKPLNECRSKFESFLGQKVTWDEE